MIEERKLLVYGCPLISFPNCLINLHFRNTASDIISQIDLVTPRTQSMSSTRDNGRAPIMCALQVCQALLTNSKKNNILDIKSPNKHIN